MNGLRICKLQHGGDHNAATVYGHSHPSRICLRIKATNKWVYDPAWEEASR